MIVWGWLFIGLISARALQQAIYAQDDGIAILSGLIAAGGWGLFAYQSLSIEASTGSELVARHYPAVAFFAAALGVIGLFIALTGPIAIIGSATTETTNRLQD